MAFKKKMLTDHTEESAQERYAKAVAQMRVYYQLLCEATAPHSKQCPPSQQRVDELSTLALDACTAMERAAPDAVRARRSLVAGALDDRAAGAQTLQHIQSMRLNIRQRCRDYEMTTVQRRLDETAALYTTVSTLVEDADPALERLNGATLDQHDDIERAGRAVALQAGRALGLAQWNVSPPMMLVLFMFALLILTLVIGT